MVPGSSAGPVPTPWCWPVMPPCVSTAPMRCSRSLQLTRTKGEGLYFGRVDAEGVAHDSLGLVRVVAPDWAVHQAMASAHGAAAPLGTAWGPNPAPCSGRSWMGLKGVALPFVCLPGRCVMQTAERLHCPATVLQVHQPAISAHCCCHLTRCTTPCLRCVR